MPEQEPTETWDGHHFKDDCPWTQPKLTDFLKVPLVYPRLIRELLQYPYIDRRCFDELKTFLATKPEKPIKTLTNGQQFDVSQFPKGTIIKISKTFTVEPPSEKHWNMWGYIEHRRNIEGKLEDEIVAFPVHHLNLFAEPPPGYEGYRNWHKSFKVGEVIHERDWIFVFGSQCLTRYGDVEIWMFGRTLRESVPQPSPLLEQQRAYS